MTLRPWFVGACVVAVGRSHSPSDEYTATCQFRSFTEKIAADCMLADFSPTPQIEGSLGMLVSATSFGCDAEQPLNQQGGDALEGDQQEVAVVVRRGGCPFWKKSSYLFSQTKMQHSSSSGSVIPVKVVAVVVVNNEEQNTIMSGSRLLAARVAKSQQV